MKENIFWNAKYDSNIDDFTKIEHTLKYGDFDDIVKLFKKIDEKKIFRKIR